MSTDPPRPGNSCDGAQGVSVIIPCFDAARTIERTVASVARQTVAPLEVIAVDDGSRDATRDVLARLAGAWPVLRVVHQANAGVAAARNAGLALAQGTWIAPLDADDLWHPQKLERQLQRAAEAGPGTNLVYTWSAEIDEADLVIERRLDLDRFEGDVYAALVHANFIGNSSNPLIRRSALQAIGGWDPSLREQAAQGAEDWDVYLKLAERGDCVLAPGFLVGYRQSTTAMSRDLSQMRRAHALVLERARRRHPELPGSLFRLSRAAFEAYAGDLAAEGRDWVGAVLAYAHAAFADPSWLARRSTRRKAVAMLKAWLGYRRPAFVKRRTPLPEKRLFAALDPMPDMIVPDSAAAQRLREHLGSMRIRRSA